jgi:hypothetical protein
MKSDNDKILKELKKEENKTKIYWPRVFLAIFDCFWIWYNLGYMFEYYHAAQFNWAAVFGVGAIIWVLLLWRDGQKTTIENKDE